MSVEPPPDEERLSLEQAMATAIQWHKEGSLDLAQNLYAKIVDAVPGHVEARHFLGLMLFQRGDPATGIGVVRLALELAPAYADAHANLANMLIQTGQYEAARPHIDIAIAQAPLALAPRLALAAVHRATQRAAESEAVLRDALAHAPDSAELHMALSETLVQLDRVPEALEYCWKAIALDPNQSRPHELMGLALSHLGRFEEAAVHFRALLEENPNHAKARHLLAACGAEAMPERASDAYVRSAFDQFAPSFDAHLARLEYQAPQLILAAWTQCRNESPEHVEALDAGCGTGLLGPLLRPRVTTLIGVDLSSAMLARARTGGHYDELIEAELTAYLLEHPERFDLVASADTLCYFGDLRPVIAAARAALRASGWLIFTVEHTVDKSDGFVLQCSGRYAHGRDYVQQALAAAGFNELNLAHAPLRKEGGRPVEGLIFAACRR